MKIKLLGLTNTTYWVHDTLLILRDSLPINSLPLLLLQRITCVKYPQHLTMPLACGGYPQIWVKGEKSYLS